jgi:cellulose biosynthesis protein BcsQ
MSVPVIAFFNNKGGVGKTSLVYHLAWMYADQGKRVLAADLDPQANLTAVFLEENRLTELLWREVETDTPPTLYGAINPLRRGVGDVTTPHVEEVDEKIGLLAGDLQLSNFEDNLANDWAKCLDRDERAFRVQSAFWRVLQKGAEDFEAAFILVDLGPNLGSINRAALIASDYVVVPLAPDLFSLQGLRNLGPRLRTWRREWQERLPRNPDPNLPLPSGDITPIGYVVMQPIMRLDRPIRAYEYWVSRIPKDYAKFVLDQPEATTAIQEDSNRLAIIKHYQSLVPMAQEARKPMFKLKPGDGALGSHMHAVQSAYRDFKTLADQIYARLQLSPEVSD